MSFVKQHALLHKHCLHKHVMNERTFFALSVQKENIRADCAPPPIFGNIRLKYLKNHIPETILYKMKHGLFILLLF